MTRHLTQDASLHDGYALPAKVYLDPAVFALETTHVFPRFWQYAGGAHALEEPGSFFTCVVGQLPVVVTRDLAGDLHAFANVCRHRGMIVASGTGRCRLLQCPYHGWTYSLDGSLHRARGFIHDKDFPGDDLGLRELKVDQWGPLVFVSQTESAPPLADYLAPVTDLLSVTSIDLQDLVFFRRYEYEIRANWKLTIENSLECLHCATAHPTFAQTMHLHEFTVHNHKHVSCQLVPIRDHEGDKRTGYRASGGPAPTGGYAHIWPNSEIDLFPGTVNLCARAFLPLARDRTLNISDYYLRKGHTEADANVVAFADTVALEDWQLCEGVQRGLISGAYEPGPLNLAQRPDEIGVKWWHRLYLDTLGGHTDTAEEMRA